jgi:transposase
MRCEDDNVALLFNVTQSVISRLYQRYRESGTVEERPRTGRPRATNNREDRLLVREARRNPRAHCNLLRQELLHATGTRIIAILGPTNRYSNKTVF